MTVHELVIVHDSDKSERDSRIKTALENAHIEVKHLARTGRVISGHIAFEPRQARVLHNILEAIPEVHMFRIVEAEECHVCT